MFKKYKGGIVLTFFLLLFPLISWYYLKEGIEYRRQNVKEMSQSEDFPVGELLDLNNAPVFVLSEDSSSVKNLMLFHINKPMTETEKSHFEKVYKQFTSVDAYFMAAVADASLFSEIPEEVVLIPADALSANYRGSGQDIFTDNKVLLIDKKGKLRKTYFLSSAEEMLHMVHEAAILLPRKSGQELKFQRKTEI
jgi:hypothetical protein